MRFILIFLINLAIVHSDWVFPNKHDFKDIGDSCITAVTKEKGVCTLSDNCSSDDQETYHNHNLCGFSNITGVVCCPSEKKKVELHNKIIGTPCMVNTTSEKGLCKLVDDCELLLDAKSNLCESGIICCPLHKELLVEEKEVVSAEAQQAYLDSLTPLPASAYISLSANCIINQTEEPGVHRILEHCPILQKDLQNGIEVPIICEEDFCRDLVCCPIEKDPHRRKPTCEHENPFDIIYQRLEYYKYSCITKNTKKPGTIISSFVCSSYDSKNTSTNPKLCPFTFCEYRTCCEKPTNPEVCMYENPKYNTVRMDGNSCTDEQTGLPGTCRILHQCLEVLNRREVNTTLCGYDCCTPVVCCPERKDRSSVGMCSTYGEAVYTRKETFQNILSTVDESKECVQTYNNVFPHPFEGRSKEMPYMAALGYQISDEQTQWQCGGALISERFVMTTAHCLRSPMGPVKYVLLGVTDLNTDSIADDCPHEYLVDEIIPHPQYTKSSRYNDIGLLRLKDKVKFNPYIRPACLPIDSTIPEGLQDLTAMGWGATGLSVSAYKDILIKVVLTYYNHTECAEVYKNGETHHFAHGIMEESQMCAESTYGVHNICVGTSGGPIVENHVQLRGMTTVYGVTSFGRSCDFVNSTTIYTKVFPYVKWIESIVWPLD